MEVVSAQSGNLIIKVKGSRLAITSQLAQRILVEASLGHAVATAEKGEEIIKAV